MTESAGYPAHQILCKVKDLCCDLAFIHEITRKDKKRNRYKKIGINSRNHLLTYDLERISKSYTARCGTGTYCNAYRRTYKKKNEDFLANNKKNAKVKVLPSGLQYEVITEGKGEKPSENSMVKVNYRGTLIDGTEFDSSFKRNEPAKFRVNQVIKGWTEALQLMPVGSKWKLYIPQELAYGEREAGQIKPFSTLVFEVELVGIEKEDNK